MKQPFAKWENSVRKTVPYSTTITPTSRYHIFIINPTKNKIYKSMNPARPFLLYADCSIEYTGRAKSNLQRGQYIIIHKEDGTLLIHGGKLSTPLNYQGPGATLTQDKNKLISTKKKEEIKITIYKELFYYEPTNWSQNQISIIKTENHLRKEVLRRIDQYFQEINDIQIEYETPLGKIDLLVRTKDDTHHIIEFKRSQATLSACSQISRYREYFQNMKLSCIGYIMSPTITENAHRYLTEHGMHYIKVEFNDI